MMAGLNVGTTNWGSFRGSPETAISNPNPQQVQQPEQSQRMNRGNFRNFQGRGNRGGVDTAPSKPPMNMGGGINVGRTSNMGILPSPMDPFRTYGTISGGRMTPPQNPYGQNQPIRYTPGGEYGAGGPGPLNVGPTQIPTPMTPPNMPSPQDYMERGGFTGGGMPPGVGSDSAGMTGYFNPQTAIPNMPQGMNRPGRGGMGSMYGGAGPSLSGGRFRGGLFY